MAHAINHFKNVALATKGPGVDIDEIGPVDNATALDDMCDVHFGINTDHYDDEIDDTIQAQADLEGLGPRILDILNRGGRTAEDTWFIIEHGRARTRGATPGFENFYVQFNRKKKVTNFTFRPGSKISGVDVSGTEKYKPGAVHKGEKDKVEGLQYGTRWSKTALEHAANSTRGNIHFHLDGMGDINALITKDSNFSHNVTSRELRYVFRNWPRFEHKVIFYNGFTALPYRAVMVEPPWLWRPDSSAIQCHHCHANFGFFTRRHHCRKCGLIFCSECTPQTKALPYPIRRPGADVEKGNVRVCDACFILP
ncbi:MAG: FYVE zinc finger domain-containing protein [Bryobacteraceae bacterium]|jgi:hypothetical protein